MKSTSRFTLTCVTTTYRIAEVADRSGYSPPTLRYYEEIGLLPLAPRSENGYRVYDGATLDRLAFITRAKQLGCSLDEVSELSRAWDRGECAPIQHGLRGVIDAKIAEAQSRVAELTAFVGDLQRVAAELGSHTPDGPCDDHCGCAVTSTSDAQVDPVPVVLTPEATETACDVGEGDAPIACSLGGGDVDQRIADWQALLAWVRTRTTVDGGVRLTFDPDTPIEAIARLAVAEHECCRFFDFGLTIDERGLALEVRAPADGQEMLSEVFGSAE